MNEYRKRIMRLCDCDKKIRIGNMVRRRMEEIICRFM